MATKTKDQIYRPPPDELASCAPEQALCYEFIDEALAQGWTVLPEYPNSRFDLLLIAGEGCSTTGVVPGTQVGVQAKMQLNVELLGQMHRAVRYMQYPGPDYVVGLVPAKPRTENEHVLEETFRKLDYGLFYNYERFEAHGSRWNRRRENLSHMLHFGAHYKFGKRIKVPDFHFWTEPGVAGPSAMTDWKQRSIRFCIELAAAGGLTYKEFKTHRMHVQTWLKLGWVVPGPTKRGRSVIYILNPDAQDRPDLENESVTKQMERARAEEEARKAEEAPGKDVP